MPARFEKRVLWSGKSNNIYRYKNLNNLPHWHIEQEIIYIDEGNVTLSVNNQNFILNKGQSAFIKSAQVHSIAGDEKSIVTVLKTDSDTVKSVIANSVLDCPVLSGNYAIGSLMQEIFIEEKDGKEYSDIIIHSLVCRLTAEIFRNEAKHPDTLKSEKHTELLKEISYNYADITFDKACEFMGLSRAYFSKYFQKTVGTTFTAYLNTVRVAAATEEIEKGEKSITEIALSCGFGTIRNFNRVFKKLMGISPREVPINRTAVKSDINGFDPTLKSTLIITE